MVLRLTPYLRATSATRTPASTCLSAETSSVSLNRDRFMAHPQKVNFHLSPGPPFGEDVNVKTQEGSLIPTGIVSPLDGRPAMDLLIRRGPAGPGQEIRKDICYLLRILDLQNCSFLSRWNFPSRCRRA